MAKQYSQKRTTKAQDKMFMTRMVAEALAQTPDARRMGVIRDAVNTVRDAKLHAEWAKVEAKFAELQAQTVAK